jgi:hypothetical protein
MDKKIPITVFLDENAPGWRNMLTDDREAIMARLWNEKAFKRAVVFTRNCRVEPVKLHDTHFAYIVI